MVLPATAALIAQAISEGIKGAGSMLANRAQKKAQKREAKETERETHAGLLNNALEGGSELEGQKLRGRKALGKAKIKGHFDTAEIVRGALKL